MVVLSPRPRARSPVAPAAVRAALVAVIAACDLFACGTLAPAGAGGSSDLPTSGAGAYHPLSAGLERLLEDPVADLADPVLLVDGEALTIYFTRHDEQGGTHIRRTRFEALEKAPSAFDSPLDDDLDGASAPAVLPPLHPGEPWLFCFAAAGALGCAGSDDGIRFHTTAVRALSPDGAAEGDALSSPAFLRLAEAPARVGLVYLGSAALAAQPASGPGLFLAAAALPNVAAEAPVFERIDARPETPARDSILSPGAAPWLLSIGRTTARTVRTGAFRLRHDLFVTGHTPPDFGPTAGLPALDVVGIAASFDGLHFTTAFAPFLAPQKPGRFAPTVAAFRGGSLLLYTTVVGRHTIVAAASAP